MDCRIRRIAVALYCLVALSSLTWSQESPIRDIEYESVPNLLKLPPDLYLGEAAGVAVNSKGHIFVFTRSSHTRLLEFDGTGKFVREIGKDLYGFSFAHAVRIDKEDNIWCVDEGANMVMEFDPQGQVKMLFGRRPETAENNVSTTGSTPPPLPPDFATFQQKLFNGPTDVAWDAAENIFVADGYGNSRVVKFDKNGVWVKEWGKSGTGPGEFHTLHSIAVDSGGNVYVGDRENHRIEIFDGEGNFLRQFTNVGAPWAICITPGLKQYLYSSDSMSGRIYKMDLAGNVLGAFGTAGKLLGQFGWVHEIACPSENTLFVAELLNWRVQKLLLH